ncbi:MAG: aminoacyl-tRNA hydrolase [Candidatus Omnitrophota bacterium]|nr:aminoacyl-tRNA hydrolase [Candidatus Omnitrophota bacterium]
MKLIIGLGNPGLKYRWTKHNLGFWVVDRLAKKNQISLGKKKFRSAFGNGLIGRNKIIILKPLSYMNLSGRPVKDFLSWFNLRFQDVVIICDDLNLDLGRIRIRRAGGPGGHKGLKSIIDHLNTRQFTRLRIGIAKGCMKGDMMPYVLSKFEKKDKIIIKQAVDKAAEAAEIIISEGITAAMNRFNQA